MSLANHCKECGSDLWYMAIVDAEDYIINVNEEYASCSNYKCKLAREFVKILDVININ